jgi:sec-independent protein translocase protein TatB
MFGMGGTEIIVILIVALLFLGPDKLPSAAKSISKGIRDIKKQSRALQQQIESDEQIGGAIRELKSALRGEDAPIRPKPYVNRQLGQAVEGTAAAGATAAIADAAADTTAAHAADATATAGTEAAAGGDAAPAAPSLTLPPTAGEADPVDAPASEGSDDLASMIKPASGTVAKGS